MDGAQIAVSSGLAGLWLLAMFILNSMKADIAQNKADIAIAKKDGIDSAHLKIAGVQAVSDEAKALAIDSLDKHNQLRVHLAENYPNTKRIEQLEAALFKKLDDIADKQDRMDEKLDRKMDKVHGLHG